MTMQTEIPQVVLRTYVSGRPRSKGSLKVFCTRGRDHKVRVEEQVAESGAWRKRVAAQVQRESRELYGGDLKLEVPLEMRVVYFFRREDEDQNTLPRPTAMTVGDLDKLDRNIGDALTSSGLIKDDKYVVRIMSEKRWAAPGATAGMQLMLLQVTENEAAEVYSRWLNEGLEGVL